MNKQGIYSVFYNVNYGSKCTNLLVVLRNIQVHNLIVVPNLKSPEIGHRRFPDDAITFIFADTGV